MTVMEACKHSPELIVMLTHHDFTVPNAAEVFHRCKESKARCWGMKEHSLPPQQMSELYAQMKAWGKTTFLEVVAYSEEEGMAGAELAVRCGCDVLMGTSFSDAINAYCREHQLKYSDALRLRKINVDFERLYSRPGVNDTHSVAVE